MQIDREEILEIGLPPGHNLCTRVPQAKRPPEEVFETKAVAELRQRFGQKDFSVLRESRSPNMVSLKVIINTARVEEFRRQIAEMEFSVLDSNSDSSRR